MKKFYILLFFSVLFCDAVYADAVKTTVAALPTGQKASLDEKEYPDAVVLLIDPKSGMIGLSWLNEKTQKEEKLSFRVDMDKVDVSNSLNQYLEFSSISAADHVDVVTIKDQAGKETVVEIVDHSATDPDA